MHMTNSRGIAAAGNRHYAPNHYIFPGKTETPPLGERVAKLRDQGRKPASGFKCINLEIKIQRQTSYPSSQSFSAGEEGT